MGSRRDASVVRPSTGYPQSSGDDAPNRLVRREEFGDPIGQRLLGGSGIGGADRVEDRRLERVDASVESIRPVVRRPFDDLRHLAVLEADAAVGFGVGSVENAQRRRDVGTVGLEGWRIDVSYPEDRDEAEARLQSETDPVTADD